MSDPRKRVHTLLTDRAVVGLDAELRAELEHLLVGAAIDPSYEAAAAAIELALMAHADPIPEQVNAAVLDQAGTYWGFAEVRRDETTLGAPRAARSIPDLRFPEEDELLDDGLLLGDPGSSAVHDQWEEERGPYESIEDAFEGGVLESSLTNGRIERVAKAEESQRGIMPPDVRRLREVSGERRIRRLTPSEPAPSEVAPREPAPREPAAPEPAAPDFEDDDEFEVEVELRDAGERRRRERAERRRPKKKRPPPDEPEPHSSASLSQVVPMPVSESRLARWATYLSAILALIMLAIAMWLYTHRDDPPDADDIQSEIEEADDAIEWTFEVKADPAVSDGAGGKVSWSSSLQSGVVKLSGLAVNDPTQSQYQLWIVDKQRTGPSVDGGVFDVTDEGEVEITVDAKLLVGEPSAFVITVERPGGVVVSEQERVVMVATRS